MVAEQFHITVDEAAAVVVAAVGIYLAFLLLVRVLGARSLTGMSAFDLAAVVGLGAIIGRTPLLAEPRLVVGALALVTFFVTQGILGFLRSRPALTRLLTPRPVLLVHRGERLEANLRRSHVSEAELRSAVRAAGLPGLAQVGGMVLEPTGRLSVLSVSAVEDEWLMADVDVPERDPLEA